MNVDLTGKVVLITGATGGIGNAMAVMFAQNGAAVAANGNNIEKGLKVVEEVEAVGGKCIFAKANVGDPNEVAAMFDKAVDAFGKVDILVNNAGINTDFSNRKNINEFDDDNWKRVMNVDLEGTYYCSKAALKTMIPNGYGRIINISSIAGTVPLRMQCAFTTAKAAINNLTRAMALDLAPYGVNVNVIVPGSIMIERMITTGLYNDGRFQSIMSHIPLKRPGTPEDISNMALFMASDAANYMTGSIVTVDGGWTCGFNKEWQD